MAAETYTISGTASGVIDVTILRREIEADGTIGSLIGNLDYIQVDPAIDQVVLEWNPAINPGPEKLALDAILAAHQTLTSIGDGDGRKVYEFTTPPTVTDDIDQEVDIGDLWVDTAANKMYGCTDNSAGAAVWTLLAPEAGNVTVDTVDPTVTDDTNSGFVIGDMWVNTTTSDAFIATDVTAGAAVWELITDRLLNGQIARAEDTTVTTHNSTTYLEKLKLTTPALVAGDYMLMWSYGWNADATNQNFRARIHEDDTTEIMLHEQEPKDAGGGGAALPPFDNTGTDQKHRASGQIFRTLGAGVHTFDIDFETQNANVEVSMWDARMILLRLA